MIDDDENNDRQTDHSHVKEDRGEKVEEEVAGRGFVWHINYELRIMKYELWFLRNINHELRNVNYELFYHKLL